MVTASKDGTWCVWNINVRYHQQEDAKCLLQHQQEVSSHSHTDHSCNMNALYNVHRETARENIIMHCTREDHQMVSGGEGYPLLGNSIAEKFLCKCACLPAEQHVEACKVVLAT